MYEAIKGGGDAEVEGEIRVEEGEILEGLVVGAAGEEDHDSLGVDVCVCVYVGGFV